MGRRKIDSSLECVNERKLLQKHKEGAKGAGT